MPGVEIQAQTIESIIEGNLLQRPGWLYPYEVLFAGFAVILVGIGFRLKRLRWVVLATNALAILAFVGSLVAFSNAQILVDVTFLIISLYVSFSIFCFGRIRRLESFLTSKSA
jgi:CHASE2 domain-containing sensor protein